MAWEWSHTEEAYDNFRANVHDLDPETLRVIWAEWNARDEDGDEDEDGFNEAAYKRALSFAVDISNDSLADDIIDRAEELRTCTNGGGFAWACPFGCGPHLVSFDRDGGN